MHVTISATASTWASDDQSPLEDVHTAVSNQHGNWELDPADFCSVTYVCGVCAQVTSSFVCYNIIVSIRQCDPSSKWSTRVLNDAEDGTNFDVVSQLVFT